MITGEVKIDLRGLESIKKGRRVVIRRAIQRAGRPARAAVEAGAGRIKRYGFLQKSIRTKVRLYPASEAHVLIIGPSMKFARTKKGEKHIPFRYANILASEKSGNKRFRPWLKDAYDSTHRQYLREVGPMITADLLALAR